MAWETDTVADVSELLEAIRTFVTTHADLVADGQEWSEHAWDGTLKAGHFNAPGLDGTETVVVGFRANRSVDLDAYTIGFVVAQAYNGAFSFTGQPGTSAERFTPIHDSPMEYWLFANGRRLIGVVKVSTVYTSFYVGKILPWGTTGDYPLPLFLGTNHNLATTRFSLDSDDLRMFCDPGLGCQILKPSLIWEEVQNYSTGAGITSPAFTKTKTLPYASNINTGAVLTTTQGRDIFRAMRDNIDGSYSVIPIVLHSDTTDQEIFGELDGVYAVSGFDNFAENEITIGADDYLVFQNISRTGRADYMAIKKE